MGPQGFLKGYPAEKSRISLSYPRRVQKHPPGDSTRITRGLHPSGALARTLWQTRTPSSEPGHPPGDSTRITRGLGGYTIGCARAHPLANPNTL